MSSASAHAHQGHHQHPHDHGHGHGQGQGHGHGQEGDAWSGEAYLQMPGMQEAAKMSRDSVVFLLEGAGIPKDQLSKLNLLEIGCGAGAVTQLYAETFGSVHAIDTSPSMLLALSRRVPTGVTHSLHALSPDSPAEFAALTPMYSPTEAEQERKLPPPRQKFDLAVANMVVHHVDDIDSFGKGLVGLVESGGWVLITEFGKVEGEADVVEEHREMHAGKKTESGSVNKAGHFHPAFTVQSMIELMTDMGLVDLHAEIRGKMPVWEDPAKFPPCLIARGRKP